MLFALGILLTIILFEPFFESSYLPGIVLALELLYILFIPLQKKKISRRFIFLCIFLVVILAWSLLINPPNYTHYIIRIFTYFSQLVIGTELFRRIMHEPKQKRIIENSFIILTTLLALYCIIEGFLQKNFIFLNFFREEWQIKDIYGYARGYRSSGSMENPLVMSFPILLNLNFSYINLRENKKKIYAISFIISMFSLYFFQTRTIYIATAICIFLVEFRHINLKKSKMKFNVFFIILITAIIGIVSKEYMIRLFSGNMLSYIHRQKSIKFVLNLMMNQNPIYLLTGHGYGSLSYKVFSERITITTKGFYAIDNEYITMLYEFGVLGMLIFLVAFIYLIKIRKQAPSNKKILFDTSFISYAIYLASFNFFHWFSLATITAFSLGAFLSDKTTIENKMR